MSVAVINAYGGPEVVEIVQVPKPRVGANDVLIRTSATTVNSGDWRIRSLTVPEGFGFLMRLMFGLRRPKALVLGTEVAGVVEDVGKNVTGFKVGDEVVAMPGMDMGAHAEYCVMKKDGRIIPKPQNLSMEQAAAMCFGGTTALSFIRTKGKVHSGEKVLVVGASGTVGLAAVQIAKYHGAEVVGVCSAKNADLVMSVGADRVIDYNEEDPFVENSFDMIVDTVGSSEYARRVAALKKNGRLLLIVGTIPEGLKAVWTSMTTDKSVIGGVADERVEDLLMLKELIESGKFKPVVDRAFPFDEIVKAHALVDSGHKRGSSVVTFV
eukprot:CAMPEP_0185845964 /NCGR_PEP_ID=MMETSP1354-20130828/1781_1 /TAXON_ID=708628 /ORGANISM="Erythrolobus madagascarensis, Strain CCMP3276" /LENGTH=323 /DNA_ID=CAMNT_0028546043 /DNA_START=106 /DNA_END=1077 /DNA_ORIENTATION=-